MRCNGKEPCARCQATPRRCTYSSRKRPAPNTQPSATIVPPHSTGTTPSPPASPEFASRINAYFTSISELVLHSPPLQYSALSQPSCDAHHLQPDLSRAQHAALLRFFARHLYPAIPVVDLAALNTAHNSHPDQPLSPLHCAAIALAVQHAYCSSLSERMLGLGLSSLPAGADASLAGYELITRCRTTLAARSLDLDPSLSDVQCHLLMSLFLIKAGHLKPAYNLLGSAVRMAYALHLHRPASGDDADLYTRVWWTLVQLDHNCSTLLRRPFAFHWSEISCPMPRNDPTKSYHTYVVGLTAAILSVTCARKRAPAAEESLTLVEAQAQTLMNALSRVREWERSLIESNAFSTLNLDPDISIASSGQTECLSVAIQDDDSGAMRHLQRKMLQVHYHNSLMTLYRSFIRFPFRSLTPVRSPRVDVNATMAVKHALAMTATVVDSFHAGDLLYGVCEVYHAQWNAVLTMAGFILSYPLCRYSRLARQHFPHAIAVFDTVAGRIATVGRLAVVGRDLCGRVDGLVKLAEESQKSKDGADADRYESLGARQVPESSTSDMSRETTSTTVNAVGLPLASLQAHEDTQETSHTVMMPPQQQQQQQQQESPAQDGNTAQDDLLMAPEQDLWSWMDIMSLPSWPDYQHGVDELFTDITDSDILMDESWDGFPA